MVGRGGAGRARAAGGGWTGAGGRGRRARRPSPRRALAGGASSRGWPTNLLFPYHFCSHVLSKLERHRSSPRPDVVSPVQQTMFSAALLPGPAPTTAGAERFRKHLRLMFNNAEEATYIENWLAWIIQRPRVPTRVMLVIVGPCRSGKTWLLGHLMGNIMGPTYHSRTAAPEKDLFGKDRRGGDASLVFMDGSVNLNRRDNLMKLKIFISGEPLFNRTMYGPVIIKANCSNYCMATNDEGTIPIEVAGRVFVAKATTIPEGGPPDRNNEELYALVDDPSFVRSVFDFLMSVDLTTVNLLRDLHPPPPGQ